MKSCYFYGFLGLFMVFFGIGIDSNAMVSVGAIISVISALSFEILERINKLIALGEEK